MDCKNHVDISIRNINLILLMILRLMNYFPPFLGKFFPCGHQKCKSYKIGKSKFEKWCAKVAAASCRK